MRRIRSSIVQFHNNQPRRIQTSCDYGNAVYFSLWSKTNPNKLGNRSAQSLVKLSSSQVCSFSNYYGKSVTSQILPPQAQVQIRKPNPDELSTERNNDPKFRSQNGGYAGKDVDHGILHQRISSASTAGELLDVVEGFNPRTVDDRALMTIIHTLFAHIKSETSESIKKDILNSVGFQKVCKILRQHCRWMTPSDLITCCKVHIFLNAPSNHATLGTLLHLLSKQANTLTLKEIIYLNFLLLRTPASPIKSALEVALPIVFESQIHLQLDVKDLSVLTDALHYASKTNLSDKTIQYICDGLIESQESLTPKQAVFIVCSLSDLKRSFPYQDVLLTAVFKIICSTMNSIPIEHLITAGNKASRKYVKNSPLFYNEDFVNGLCDRILKDDAKPENAMLALKCISLMKHVNIDMMDKISTLTLENPTIVLNSDYFFKCLIRSFSGSNYKPEKWNNLAPIFLEHPSMTKDLGPQEVGIAVDFLAIDVLPTTLVTKIFAADNIKRLEGVVEKASPHLLLLLLNTIKLLYAEEYFGPMPPKTLVESWKALMLTVPKIYPLKGSLHTGFGGENYVVTGLFHEGFHIDHGVLLRKGGYPISINKSEMQTLSRLQENLPLESIVVLVKVFMSESYANNTNRLRGVSALELKLLERLGHPVVAIDLQRWKELQDFEKIPYLMHRIREKCEKMYKNDLHNSNRHQ